MKNRVIKFAASLLLLSGFASCNLLDIEPLDSYSSAAVFSDPKLAETYVNQRYTEIRNGYGGASLKFACDESMNNFNWNSVYIINQGQLTPDQMGGFDVWSIYFTAIKNCNIFLEQKDRMPNSDTKDRLTGEITFLRAYFYSELVNRYGGVPIITKVFSLTGDMNVPRNSYDDCIKFIADECDKAASLLPVSQSSENLGRATKGAAMALKAKELLYAASPLWNTSNDKSKWQAAADAAKAVIDLKDNNGNPAYSLDPSYSGWYLNRNSKEIIFQRVYNKEFGQYWDWNNSPNGYNGYSACCVTQEMVDSYEMADGTMPTANLYANADGIHSTPWEGREPRFYASIVCDGQQFRGREVEFWVAQDGNSGGKDSEKGLNDWNYSKSHYTVRKFMDESLRNAWSDKSDKSWVFSRLGEIYLDYAEAMFNTGNEGAALQYINKIRARARGTNPNVLPDINKSGAELLAAIQHERKIELAFEDHRFFDVRRWKIATTTENKAVHRIDITKDKTTGVKTYTINKLQDRYFYQQHYLFPIPRTEMQRVPAFVQNPNYN